MRVLIDTNVVLDVLLDRAPFADASSGVLEIEEDRMQSFVSAAAVTDIYFVVRKTTKSKTKALALLRHLLDVVQVAGVSKREIFAALDSGWSDFEDAVQNAVAESNGFDAIVTRDPSGFAESSLPVYTPGGFLAHFP